MSVVLLMILCWLVWRIASESGRRRERAVLEAALRQAGPRGMRGLLMCEHDEWAYWRVDGELMRAPIVTGRAELRYAQRVDVLDCPDLSPADAVAVLDALDEAEVRYRLA